MPQVAMAQSGSFASTSRNVFSAALYQNECSIATARSNCGWTFGSQLVGKETLPSGPVCDSSSCACAGRFAASAAATTNAGWIRRNFMAPSFGG